MLGVIFDSDSNNKTKSPVVLIDFIPVSKNGRMRMGRATFRRSDVSVPPAGTFSEE